MRAGRYFLFNISSCILDCFPCTSDDKTLRVAAGGELHEPAAEPDAQPGHSGGEEGEGVRRGQGALHGLLTSGAGCAVT